MKQLNINITKAQLKSYTVELKDGKPEVSATIELYTEGGMAVTTYTVATDSWNDKNKFDLPIAAIAPIIDLAKALESVTVNKCRDSQLALTSGIPTDPIQEQDLTPLTLSDTITISEPIENLDDKPIDLTEIPF